LNNNRNNRRRGRGNRNNQGGGGNQLNRIDSRARGNAPQLLDKYKKLAQDAQHHGDRVQMEYYLQFADHYLRVIADNKARQDEARAKRNEGRTDERDQANDDSVEGEDSDNRRNDGRRGNNRRPRSRRDETETVVAEGETGVEGEAAEASADTDETAKPKPRARKPRGEGRSEGRSPRARKPRNSKADESAGGGEIDSAVLPPAIGGDDPSDGDGGDNLEAVG